MASIMSKRLSEIYADDKLSDEDKEAAAEKASKKVYADFDNARKSLGHTSYIECVFKQLAERKGFFATQDYRLADEMPVFDNIPSITLAKSGVLSLQTGQPLPHCAEYYFTKKSPVTYDMSANRANVLQATKRILQHAHGRRMGRQRRFAIWLQMYLGSEPVRRRFQESNFTDFLRQRYEWQNTFVQNHYARYGRLCHHNFQRMQSHPKI
jgi:phage/plasmid-associated DNA primase